MVADDLLKPGKIAGAGFEAAHPMLDVVKDMLGFPEFFGNFLNIAVLLIAWFLVVLAFFILAIQLFITILEFKLTTLAGFVLVPFSLWNKSSFLAERVLGNVISSGIKVMVLAVIVGIGANFFTELAALIGSDPDTSDAMTLLLGALSLMGLGIFGPGIASGLVSGAPQLGAGAAVGTVAGAAIMTGGAAMLGARGAMMTGRGGMSAIRAGTAMGSAAMTAAQLGREAGVSSLRGIGAFAAESASQKMNGAFGIGSAAERGREAVLSTFSRGRASAASQPSSESSAFGGGTSSGQAVPAWAQKLRSEQTARHHRHIAAQTIKDGDRPGGAANPDLSDKE